MMNKSSPPRPPRRSLRLSIPTATTPTVATAPTSTMEGNLDPALSPLGTTKKTTKQVTIVHEEDKIPLSTRSMRRYEEIEYLEEQDDRHDARIRGTMRRSVLEHMFNAQRKALGKTVREIVWDLLPHKTNSPTNDLVNNIDAIIDDLDQRTREEEIKVRRKDEVEIRNCYSNFYDSD